MKRLIMVVTMFLGIAGMSFAQTSATVNVTATVISALTITSTASLAMGNIPQNSTKQVLATSGSAAQLTVTGNAGSTFMISWNTAVTLTDVSGLNPISFTPSLYGSNVGAGTGGGALGTSTGTQGILSGTGEYYISVGGGLNPGSAPSGSYSTANTSGAPLTVTVAYN